MITKAVIKNIKGITGDFILGALTLITGRNARGKTAILEAVKIGLIGYSPKLGKKPASTFKLSSADKMGVQLIEPDKGDIERAWVKSGSKVSLKEHVAFETPLELLDFRDFLSKTGPEQVKYVIDRSDLRALGFSRENFVGIISALKLEEPTEYQVAAKAALVKEMTTWADEREPMPEWIASVVSRLKDKNKRAKDKLDDMTGHMRGGTQLREQEQAAPVRPLETIKRDIETKRNEREQLRLKVSSLSQAQRTYDNALNRKRELEATIEEVKRNAVARRRELEEIIAEAKDNTARINTARENKAEIEKRLSENKGINLRELSAKNTQAATKYDLALSERNRIKRELVTLQETFDKEEAEGKCSRCGFSGKGFIAHIKEQFENNKAAKEEALQTADDALEVAENLRDRAATAWKDACDADDLIQKDRDNVSKLQSELEELNAEDLRVSNAKAELAQEGADVSNAQAALKEIIIPEKPNADTSELETQIDSLTRAIGTLETEQSRSIGEAHENKRRAEAAKAQQEKEAEIVILKLALKRAEEEQARIVEDTMAALMTTARKFTDGILQGSLHFRDGEIGVERNGSWISHEVLSGTEQALVYLGLSAALCQSAPVKIVMLDEMGVIDDINAPKALQRMDTLQREGIIHQFIGCDIDAARYSELKLKGRLVTHNVDSLAQ